MISLTHTEKRKLSKNPAQSRKIALFFTRRCPAAFQRQALSEMLGQVSISPNVPTETLAIYLENWFLGKKDALADTILSGTQTIPSHIDSIQMPVPSKAPAAGS